MLSSRVCWQLLLGWALLLSQPVFGDSDAAEQPSLEDPEKLVPEETEEPVPEETGEPVPEEPKELVPEETEKIEPEEMEEPMSSSEETVSVPEELEKEPPPEEELEEMERAEREWLEHEKERPCSPWLQYLQQIVVGHYNKKRNEYFKLYGNSKLKTKKAIGSMIYLKMVLEKTNCTKDPELEQMHPELMYPDIYMLHRYHYRQFQKNCETLKNSEQECSFTMFDDERSRQWPPMMPIDEKCKPLHLDKKSY